MLCTGWPWLCWFSTGVPLAQSLQLSSAGSTEEILHALLLEATQLCVCVQTNQPVCLHSQLRFFHPEEFLVLAADPLCG